MTKFEGYNVDIVTLYYSYHTVQLSEGLLDTDCRGIIAPLPPANRQSHWCVGITYINN